MTVSRAICFVFSVGTLAGIAAAVPLTPPEAASGGSSDDLIGEEAFRSFHFLFNPPAPVARPRVFPLLDWAGRFS